MVLIGVTPAQNDQNGQITINPDCMDAVRRAGGLPVLLPLYADEASLRAVLAHVDGLVLTGGADVDPALYGEERLPQCGATDPWRDRMEEAYIGAFVRAGKPIFGICRGAQMINVALGGTLYQDISAQLGVSHNFGIVHEVTSCADTFAYDLFGARFMVNSFHHQAIRKLAPSLRPAAYAEDGKIAEAFVHETLPILGVQWHPERMTGDDRMTREGPAMQRLFLHFLHLL